MTNLRYILIFATTLLIVGCGGGGSNSGAASLPAAPIVSMIPAGVYEGPIILTFTGGGADETPFESTFRLTVTGSIVGQQQVIVAFRSFSGSSAIVGPDNAFSLPSGLFLQDVDAFGRCEVELTYSGNLQLQPQPAPLLESGCAREHLGPFYKMPPSPSRIRVQQKPQRMKTSLRLCEVGKKRLKAEGAGSASAKTRSS